MDKEIVWAEPGRARGLWPLGVRVGQYIFLSAMLPVDPATGRLVERQADLPGGAPRLATGSLLADAIEERMATQSWYLYHRIEEVLRTLGSSREDILLLTGWLADFREWPAMNRVRGAFFPSEWFPPSTSFGVPGLVLEGARVTFDTIALSRDGGDLRKETVGTNVQVGNYFPGSKTGSFLFLAGDVAADPSHGLIVHGYEDLDQEGRKLATGKLGLDGWEGPIRAQTWFIYQRLEELLRASGSSLADVVKQAIYIRDPRDYPACEGIMRMVFADRLPPTTVVHVDEYGSRHFLVEVELTVALSGAVEVQRIERSAVPSLGAGFPIGTRAGHFVFLSGLHPLGTDGRPLQAGAGGRQAVAERQAEQVYQNLQTILGEQGLGMDATVRQVIYVADRSLAPVVERVAAAAFGESPPATTVVPLRSLWPSPTLVQVDAMAMA